MSWLQDVQVCGAIATEEPGIHPRRRHHAGAGRRRQRRHLQRRQHGDAAAAALRRTLTAWSASGRATSSAAGRRLRCRIPTSSTSARKPRACSRWRRPHNAGFTLTPANGDAEVIQGMNVTATFLPTLRRHAGARPQLHRRRRSARRQHAGGPDERRPVAARVWRRPERDRPNDHVELAALHGDWRPAGQSFSGARTTICCRRWLPIRRGIAAIIGWR